MAITLAGVPEPVPDEDDHCPCGSDQVAKLVFQAVLSDGLDLSLGGNRSCIGSLQVKQYV